MKKLLKTIFPSPLLSCLIIFFWLVLNATLHPAHLLLAAVLGFIIPLFTLPLRPTPVKIRRPKVIFKLFFDVVCDVVSSNIQVAMAAMRIGKNKPKGEFVKIPLDTKNPNTLTMLALICTIIPGTIWSELALDRSAVYIHFFDPKNTKEEAKRFKSRYEKPLMEIFE